MSERFSSLLLPILAALLAATGCVSTGPQPLLNLDRGGVAIHGYDPVSYFPEGGGVPTRGKAELESRHDGAMYRFVTPENLARFELKPERYTPAYGGWCAWAMVEGARVDVDPRSFLIEDGRLLLFYDGLFADTRASWREASSPALGTDADAHWQAIVREASATK